MATKYDIFYLIGKYGEMQVNEIVETLQQTNYNAIFNAVLELEKDGYVTRKDKVHIINNKQSQELFNLIAFCIKHSMNYNLLFKETMLNFLERASKKEFFTIKDTTLNPRTYTFYTDALFRWGFLLIVSRKPSECKLLRHHFIVGLLTYFKKNAAFYKSGKSDFIMKIKKELAKYKKNLKIHYTVLQRLKQKEEIGFIYTSLSLEGNPITLPDTIKILAGEKISLYKVEHIQEITNYKRAVEFMIENAENKVPLTLDLILRYHAIAMHHIYGAGEIRRHNVKIKDNPTFDTSDWKLIGVKIKTLLEQYDAFEAKKNDVPDVITFATFFHNEFQRIHPFNDGNSRISRLLMLHILRLYDIPVLDLPIGYFDLYLELTKMSTKRDDDALRQLIEEIIYLDLKRMNADSS